jgi:hypothetical protein
MARNQGRGDFARVGEVPDHAGEVPSVAPRAAPTWIAEHRALVLDVPWS